MAKRELYALRVTPADSPMDAELPVSMDEVCRASAKDPDRWHNNPEKKRRALECLGRVIADWEAANGAITEDEMACLSYPHRRAGPDRPNSTLETAAPVGYVARMTTTHEPEAAVEADGKVYVLRLIPGNGPIHPDMAAALERVSKVADNDPNRWHNNPAKKKAALEGLGRFLAEWQEENGAFTEEELARAHAELYGE